MKFIDFNFPDGYKKEEEHLDWYLMSNTDVKLPINACSVNLIYKMIVEFGRVFKIIVDRV